jgi:hypothetical protein
MTKQRQDNIGNWLKSNLWNLIITGVALVIAFVTIQGRVSALEIKTDNLQTKINQYPSQDYFDLRFTTLESGQNEIRLDLKKHLEESN